MKQKRDVVGMCGCVGDEIYRFEDAALFRNKFMVEFRNVGFCLFSGLTNVEKRKRFEYFENTVTAG